MTAARAAFPVCPRHMSLLSSPRCHCLLRVLSDVVFPPADPYLPLLLPGKREAEEEALTDLVFKATMVAACDSLAGQAIVTTREGIWTFLQLLDMIPLL